MITVSLDKVIDVSTGAFVGFLSVSGLMSTYRCPRNINNCDGQSNESKCVVSPCSRINLKLAVGAGFVTSGLYLYRGLRN